MQLSSFMEPDEDGVEDHTALAEVAQVLLKQDEARGTVASLAQEVAEIADEGMYSSLVRHFH